MFDLILKNGTVVDGTGNPWFKADIGILGGKIESVSRTPLTRADRLIDIHGLVAAPGFVDIHNHSDQLRREGSILIHNRAENLARQGITTIATGTCGMSAAPLTPQYREHLRSKMMGSAEIDVDWLTLREWIDRCEKKRASINICPFVGFGTIRSAVMGEEGSGGERSEPTEAELERMEGMVRQAMMDGAFGITTGLEYPPQRNAYTEEIIEICKVASGYGGVYMSHIRSEDDFLIEAVNEFIKICEDARIAGSISHHKACSPTSWGKPSETMRLIKEARTRGDEVICDVYPWISVAISNVGKHFIQPSEELDIQRLISQLKDPEEWKRIKEESKRRVDEEKEANERRKRALSERDTPCPIIWDPTTYYVIVYSRTRPEFMWKNFKEVSAATGISDPWDAMRWLYMEDEGHTHVGLGYSREEDIITIYKHPWVAVSTDASAEDTPHTLHPRGYGTYPRFIERYVRELRIMSLEEAVRRMTSLPAQFLGLQDRGVLRAGSWADVVVFDPEIVRSNATYASPREHPEGIPYVIVNGEVIIENGSHSGLLPGKVLCHAPKSS